MPTHMLLLRHAATDVTDRQLTGRTPHIPLSAAGRNQATALAKRLTGLNRLITSPIQRALQTAAILADDGHPSPESMALFSEFDFGEWTGRSFLELRDDPEWQRFNEARDATRAPGGESMHDVQKRAVAGLRQLIREEEGRTVAVVSHADVIRAIVLHFTHTPMNNFWRFQVDPASITELVCGPEGDERIVRLNDCAHLKVNEA